MAIPASFLDELRNRVSISEVVGRKVTWDRKKTNQRKRDYWACCPFHGEKTPSFHVEDSKGRYYCFGCHVSGDIVKWMMEAEGLEFREAVQHLADLAGLEVPQESPQERERQEKKKTLVDALEIAAKWFEESLKAPELGHDARRYLKDARQLTPDTIRKFRLGFAPGDTGLFLKAMERNGLTMAMLQEAGLMTNPDPEDGRKPAPYFRDRIMFPILDGGGKVVAFGGRDLSGRSQAKYLNSPETAAFSKSHTLYNFQTARAAARKAGTIIVSEGYMDVIAFDRGGFDNAVAPLGTALTEPQLNMLWRSVAEPVLAFDGDGAGRKAAFRSADLALAHLQPGRSLRFAFLPDGKDPDDLLNVGGRQALADVLEAKLPLVDVL
ncbi:MAG: DNA primase, partial [Alphaproteobacteria bacterium]